MDNTAKKFLDVFGRLQFSSAAKTVLAKSSVEGVYVNKRQKSMSVGLCFGEIIDESCLAELKSRIISTFPAIEDVELSVRYTVPEQDASLNLSLYWENIVSYVTGISPLCGRILREARWRLGNSELTVFVQGSAFVLNKKELDKKIEALLKNRLGLNIRVCFSNEAMDRSTEARERRFTSGLLRLESIRREEPSPIASAAPASMAQPKPPLQPGGSKLNASAKAPAKRTRGGIKLNNQLDGPVWVLSEEIAPPKDVLVKGVIFDTSSRETKNGSLLVSFDMTDGTGSVTVKFFCKPELMEGEIKGLITPGQSVAVKGKFQFDEYTKENNIMADEIGSASQAAVRADDAVEKRVELHLHTQMSSMDGVTSATDYINRASKWGHKAIAITDHGVLQAYPEAMSAAKKFGVKVIYGVEAYIVDDLIEMSGGSEFVVFDIETTGLNYLNHKITEIGAVKIKNKEITDSFNALINPETPIPPEIVKLTGITDEMVRGQKTIAKVLPEFLTFAGDAVMVAHNADFDMGFIRHNAKKLGYTVNNKTRDTLSLSQMLFPELTRHKLDVVAKHLNIDMGSHHRAVDDARTAAHIFLKCAELMERGEGAVNHKKLKYHHAVILVKNLTGLKNLYELVSLSHIKYFAKRPRIPKSEYLRHKEGLIIGTACESGELFRAVMENEPDDRIRQVAEFYDYFELQPNGNNMFMVRNGKFNTVSELNNINKEIVRLGELYQKPVVATCDVHFLDQEDAIYRQIIMQAEGYKDASTQAPLFYRTTGEMLEEFEYLGKEKAYEVVVTNTNLIADMTETLKPIPDGTFPPIIEGSDEQIIESASSRAKSLYGDNLPEVVLSRLNREMDSIIKNGFAVMYVIARKLVIKSVADGYPVGSRGSVGSSFAATMTDITEVNPLSPHYLCSACKYSDFDSDTVKKYAGASGCDMPDKNCPVCGSKLSKDGHDIPFETFLGFDGDKEPDIDLNFSGEYQAVAHAYTEELFGEGQVFKAGTIGTMADKTAFGFVKKFLEETGATQRAAETNRLVKGLCGIKRTTGQHPGGLVIVPAGMSIYEFCPVQRPANDQNSNVVTTHFDYHSIKGRLLKMDILGHDVPTIIHMLHEITGVDPQTVDLGDKKTISLFSSPDALNVTPDDINCKTGTLGLPEFGTGFVRQMLVETKPSTFAELVRISGLSHGTGVWLNNAQDLIREKTATLKEIIATRDDVMLYLIQQGVEKKTAFKIMENVRNGRGVTEDEEETMLDAGIPEWYIQSCRRIEYLFPKSHAVAYVMMTVRIGWFKIHHPYAFYAASFSVKAEDFNYELMCFGKERAAAEMSRINALGKDAPAKEKSTLSILELVLEMYARGLKFAPLNLYRAEPSSFLVTDEGLMAPLCSVQGLGLTAANSVAEARQNGEFLTVTDFRERTRLNKTVIELLKKVGVLDGLPETSQMSLF